ncbi:MAG: hypothetical protein OXL40_11550, partial [Bacteroidota bacterium]|nr:hypothetical protein [Bacteroidota bacterium]
KESRDENQRLAKFYGELGTTMINIAQVPDVKPGQVVEIIASDREAVNSVSNIASICDTTPHVIFSGVSPLLRRVIVE